MMLIGESVSDGSPAFELVGIDVNKIDTVAPAIFESAKNRLHLTKITFINSDYVFVKEAEADYEFLEQVSHVSED